jgi:hypothetical protein
MIEKRTHTAGSELEAVRIVKENFHISAPTASGFPLSRKDGMGIPVGIPGIPGTVHSIAAPRVCGLRWPGTLAT